MSRRPRTIEELTGEARSGIVEALARRLPAHWLVGPAAATGDKERPDPFGYAIGYAALLDLVSRTNLTVPRQVRGALYAVYGWMPTTLRAIEDEGVIAEVGTLAMFAQSLRPDPSGAVPDGKLDELFARFRSGMDLKTRALTAATNNAPVGLSKFLHLAAPNVVPIWDRRICMSLGWGEHNAGSLRHFEAYVRALYRWRREGGVVPLDDPTNPAATGENDPNGWVRAVEWYLFRVGPPAG